MAFGAADEPVLSRLNRIDNMLRQLEEIRTGSRLCRTPKSSCASTPSSGTLTSESLDLSSPKSLEKQCRPVDEVIVETESKGTLMERLLHVEDKVLKICTQLEAELEAERRRSDEAEKQTPTSSPRRKKKKGLRQLVRNCVKGNPEQVRQ
uniref:Uncharacterized protein n=1 Tax=Kalanchoe fedtschenkoi TaxID=63787 RepID=A0A7N0R969_KALFE